MHLPSIFQYGKDVGEGQRMPVLLHLRSSKWYIAATVIAAICTDIFLYGVIVPVIPFALQSRLHIEHQDVQRWVSILLATYSSGLLAFSPPMGWIADRVKTRRSPLLGGVVLLTGATLMLCLGKSVPVLIVGRLLQGLSAAVAWVTGLALLVDTFGQEGIGQTMGIVSLAYSMGILVAPLLGGVVFNAGGYYAVFEMAFGLIFIDIVLRLTFIEKKVAARYLQASAVPEERPLDHLRRGSTEVGQPPVEEPAQPSTRPKLPPILYLASSRRMLCAFWGILVIGVLSTAFDTTLPLYASQVFGFNAQDAGLLFLALLVPSVLAPFTGKFSDKYGPRWLATLGFVLAMPFLVLLRLVTHKTTGQIVLLCALLSLIGFSFILSLPPLMAEFTLIASAKESHHPGLFGERGAYAQAYAIFNSAWAAGAIIGPLWAGFVQAKAGWATMTWTLGLLSIVSSVPIAMFTGGFIVRGGRHHLQGQERELADAGSGLEAERSVMRVESEIEARGLEMGVSRLSREEEPQ